ncbi:SMC-Scp complex subunit ScpB [Roseobacter weihaiensis]|uniref:SMC-Scp complex subunit ScpB n=1 Tax=Roseobacter weihaiensis TaxID=2763262 RepID=UPI001D0B20B1|nr:SMC-Scp complex subunit ScpB [Roseobacter sp. H9]
MVAARRSEDAEVEMLDIELEDLPAELRWREWMNRIEAVIFASSKPVARDALSLVVGKAAKIDLLIEDIQADLKAKPYEIVLVAGGWMFRTRSHYATAIRTAADVGDGAHDFSEEEMAVLCAVAYHQPIDRAGLADIFGKEINRDLLSRLRYKNLIGNGPKSPRPGAPHTFVTTDEFLATFDLQSLRDLPELEFAPEEPHAIHV